MMLRIGGNGMNASTHWTRIAVALGLVWTLFTAGSQASAAESSPYALDPVLSLTGNCSTSTFDPVPDPSCSGEPLVYQPPPNGSSGRFDEARAIAVDTFGDEYVASYANSDDAEGRIDVFDDEGRFLTEVAVPNIKSIAVDGKGNLYVYEDNGKVVRYSPSEYEPEAGKVKYENPPATVSTGSFVGALAVDNASDRLLVARGGTIVIYGSADEANVELESFKPDGIGAWTEAIAVDPQRRRIYVSYCKNETTECGIKVIEADAPHAVLKNIEGPSSTERFAAVLGLLSVAVDEGTGDLFVGDIETAKTVYQFEEGYKLLSKLKSSEFQAGFSIQIAVSNGKRSPLAGACGYPDPAHEEVPVGDACNRHYLFIPTLKPAGRAIAFRPPGETPPVIEEVSTAGVGETEAELRAKIFPGGLEADYHFELTTQEIFEVEGFQGAATFGEGAISSDSLADEVKTFATGLLPGETYRFRVVAENGLGKAAEEDQNEAIFTTYSDVPVSPDCANQAFRIGLSAQLPDCRAYELVTPPDTNGRAPKGVGFVGELFTSVEASPAGDAVWFKVEGGSVTGSAGVGSFEGDPYVATRGASGWISELAGATGEEATVSIPGSSSPDQGYAFWSARIEGPLVLNGEETQYLYYPDGHSELIGRGSLGADPKARGRLLTENAGHVIFETVNGPSTVAKQLEPIAPPNGTRAVYDRTIGPNGEEQTHVVSLLPEGATPAAGQDATYLGASTDGEGIAFTIDDKLYLRVGNETTYEIGEGVEFAGVSEGGRIFYVEGGDLEAFDIASEEVIDFTTTGDATPVNVSSVGTRAYFVSTSAHGGANPEGDSAQAGEQNLYLSEDGVISFVATVTDRDVDGEGLADGLGLWTKVGRQIAKDPSRTNPDGSVLLFQSRANITGYEESKFPQIYRYDSVEEELQCISCIPTGTAANGGASLQTYTFDSLAPPPLSPNAFVPGVTPNGNRVFFESTEALVSTDTDEVQDVYEWEAQGVGSCTELDGCVFLITSGQSERENFLYAHSQSGDDVFFTTEDALTDADTGGAASIYDAKVGGGFPEESGSEPCTADGCRPTVSPTPAVPSPVSSAQGQSGNLKPRKPKTCPKGKRKAKQNGKVRCVKKKKHKAKSGQAKQRAGTNRRAGK